MRVSPPARQTRVWGGLLVVYFFWGSTYLGIAVANESLPPLFAAATRFLVAGVILLLAALLTGALRRDRPSLSQVAGCALVGILLFGGGNGLVVLAELRIPTGVTSLVISLSPILVALISFLAFRLRPGRLQVAGMVLGFAGIAILAHPGGSGGFNPLGLLMALGSAVCWSSGSIVASRADLPRTPMVAAGIQLVVGAGALIAFGLLAGEAGGPGLAAATLRSKLAVVYLIVFGSLLAFTVYSWLVRNAPLSLVFTYVYVNPVVAVGLGALILGERITLNELVGGIVILGSVAMIVTGQAVAGRNRRGATSGRPESVTSPAATAGDTAEPADANSSP